MPATLTLQPTGQVLTVPTSWYDVTLATFVALFAPEPDDERRPAELLLGLAAGALDPLAADDVAYIGNLLAFAEQPGDVYALHPTVGLPEVGSMSYGTLALATQHIQAANATYQEQLAEAGVTDPQAEAQCPWLRYAAYLLAIYRVEMTYGKYDHKRVQAAEAALLAAPVTETLPDAQYFFLGYTKYTSATHLTPRTSPSPAMTKSKLGQKPSPKISGRLLAWMRRLRATS